MRRLLFTLLCIYVVCGSVVCGVTESMCERSLSPLDELKDAGAE